MFDFRDFDDDYRMSKATKVERILIQALTVEFGFGVSAIESREVEDKRGTDWFVTLANGRELRIDTKVRKNDCIQAFGEDDLALETWSVVGRRIGWTLDENKTCDHIAWIWKDTERFCMVDFEALREVFRANRNDWEALYGPPKRQRTYKDGFSYWSECLFVPRLIVLENVADYLRWTCGMPR